MSRLWTLVRGGDMARIAPEIMDLAMEQDPVHRHKDVLAHTIIVVGQAPDDLTVRLAALFHDIGKPLTRKFQNGEVTFHHHEEVGARLTRARMTDIGFDAQLIDDVCELVRLSGRFKGYAAGWSDSAVRRYCRDAGRLLPQLNQLVRSDCTTRNQYKAADLQHQVDDLERRIAEIAETDRRAAERPQIDGRAVMDRLGVGPGPHVGQALAWMMKIKHSEGDLNPDELLDRLDRWWAANTATAATPPEGLPR